MLENRPLLKYLFIFLVLVIGYTGFGSALSFHFEECDAFPNYNMLTQAFARGRLDVDAGDAADLCSHDGKAYMYFGPMPAVMRLPLYLATGRGVSTGFMIALFLSGTVVWYLLILQILVKENEAHGERFLMLLFGTVLAGNGYSLSLAAFPTVHNEAICGAMFYFMGAIYIYLTIRDRNFQAPRMLYVLLGIFLAAAFGCRFSYVFAAGLLGLFLIVAWWRRRTVLNRRNSLLNIAIVAGFGIIMLAALLGYNHQRFDAALDFGNKQVPSYRNYFNTQGFFRYDHIPYNLWNIFFRLPEIEPQFPFVRLPRYIVEVKTLYLTPYRLVNTNELSASIFLLMPITLLILVPGRRVAAGLGKEGVGEKRMFDALFLVQVLVLAPTVAMTVRYYYDFLPIMLVSAFLGARGLQRQGRISNGLPVFLGVLSLVISFTVLVNALEFYPRFIQWQPPLFSLFR